METLTKLFGNAAKVKTVKLFVFNSGTPYDAYQVADRTKESLAKVRSEVTQIQNLGLVRRKSFYKNIVKKIRGRKVTKKVKTNGWVLNDNFVHLVALRTFLVNVNHLAPKDVAKKLSRVGNIKLVVVSGVFIHNAESRVDLLVVGDNIKKGMLENAIKIIESEIGVELRYAYFETADFRYRLGLYDKLVRDILDFPHETVINKLGIVGF